jgi:hypothetical protein
LPCSRYSCCHIHHVRIPASAVAGRRDPGGPRRRVIPSERRAYCPLFEVPFEPPEPCVLPPLEPPVVEAPAEPVVDAPPLLEVVE